MPDREKVINGLREMSYRATWKDIDRIRDKFQPIINDALALLKEQEAKWVEDKQDDVCRLIKCSNCGLTFIVGNNIPYDEWIVDKNYCRRCGARMVKRNDK